MVFITLLTTASTSIGSVLAVVVAACGAAGVFSGMKTEAQHASIGRYAYLMEALSSGVLLSVAILHILGEAQVQLSGLSQFPFANAVMLSGFYLMSISEVLAPSRLLASKREGASKVSFYLLEAAISFHSVMIGLAVGFSQSGRRQLTLLGAALCVHQGCAARLTLWRGPRAIPHAIARARRAAAWKATWWARLRSATGSARRNASARC